MKARVESFYDPATFTFTYVVHEGDNGRVAVIDPVLAFDPVAAHAATASADRVLEFVTDHRLTVDWILETHARADHRTAAADLKARTGAKVAIGRGITQVQERFKPLFGLEPEFPPDGRKFDRLFGDRDTFRIDALQTRVLATPGHTDDGLIYLIGDAAFTGDTVFAPETGTARTDFHGSDARKRYRSIHSLFELPDATRLSSATTIHRPSARRRRRGRSRTSARNVHVGANAAEDAFVQMRTERDAGLAPPRLILPALQVNIRAGELPPAAGEGHCFLRIPPNRLQRGSRRSPPPPRRPLSCSGTTTLACVR